MVDAGKDAPKGERFARVVPCVSGNARQRRQTLRRLMRQALAH
jgi:hypothetical protein